MTHPKNQPPTADDDSPERPVPPPYPTKRRWDEVDESSWESFPCSDAPPYGGGAKDREPDRGTAERE